MSLRIATHPLGPISANCHLLLDDDRGDLVVVDPGGDAPSILAEIANRRAERVTIWLTHGHIDHIGAAAEVARATGAPVWVHRDDLVMLRDSVACGAALFDIPFEPVTATNHFTEDSPIEALGATWHVLHCPGHSPGSVVLHAPALQMAVAGDVLFRGSIGRTDLPGGDPRAMTRSLRRLFRELPADTRILTGHGPDTTIAFERDGNPYVRLALGTTFDAEP